jgi:dTMP kinase
MGHHLKTVKYIALEGVDGVGKSTLAAMLAEALSATLTREPGSIHIALKVRDLILARDNLDRLTVELLLHADRNEHTKWVDEELDGGRSVVSDRSFLSGIAYGMANGLEVRQLFDLTSASVKVYPDIIFMVSSDKAEQNVLDRGKWRRTREERGPEFTHKLTTCFDAAIGGIELICSTKVVKIDISNETPQATLSRMLTLL